MESQCALLIVCLACGCNHNSTPETYPTEAIPGGRESGRTLPYIASGSQPVVVSNGTHCGELPMAEIDPIRKLPITPYEAWDQSRISSVKWLLSTEDRKTLQIRSGKQFEHVRSFAPMHGVRITGAVIDKSRKRIVTVGRDEPSRTEVDEFGGEGSLRVWDFDGKALQSPYYLGNEPVSIARSRYTDHIVVGTRGGGVHVFRSDRDGVDVAMHGELWSTIVNSVAMSSSGSYFAAAGAAGTKIWKYGDVAPKVELYAGRIPEEALSDAVTIIHDWNTYPTGRAVVISGNHVRVFQLGDDISLEHEFDVDLPGVQKIGPSARAGVVVIIGMVSDRPAGAPPRFHIYTLNVDTKVLTKLSWKSAESPTPN